MRQAARRLVSFSDKHLAAIGRQHERYTCTTVGAMPQRKARRTLVNDVAGAQRASTDIQTEGHSCNVQSGDTDRRREPLKKQACLEWHAQQVAQACKSPCEIGNFNRRVRTHCASPPQGQSAPSTFAASTAARAVLRRLGTSLPPDPLLRLILNKCEGPLTM